MHIKSSFHHVMKSISTAFSNVMPSQCRTLHHKLRVVKNTQNVPAKKTKGSPSKVKLPSMKVDANGIVSKRLDEIQQNQFVHDLRHDSLFPQREKNSIIDASIVDMNKEKRSGGKQGDPVSGTTHLMSALSSPIPSLPAQTGLFIDSLDGTGDDLYRSRQAEPQCGTSVSLPNKKEKSYIIQVTTQAEVHGKPGKRKALLPSAASKKAEPVLTQNGSVILPPQTRKEVPQRMVLQPLGSIDIKRIRNASLYIRRGGVLPSLASVPEYSSPTSPQNHELYAVFARRRTPDAIAKTMQGIVALESRSSQATLPLQLDTGKMHLQRHAVDDSFIAVDAYMRDASVRLIIDKNGEMVI
jgi:hypothetical protein